MPLSGSNKLASRKGRLIEYKVLTISTDTLRKQAVKTKTIIGVVGNTGRRSLILTSAPTGFADGMKARGNPLSSMQCLMRNV